MAWCSEKKHREGGLGHSNQGHFNTNPIKLEIVGQLTSTEDKMIQNNKKMLHHGKDGVIILK
jgi:hypothetical protein